MQLIHRMPNTQRMKSVQKMKCGKGGSRGLKLGVLSVAAVCLLLLCACGGRAVAAAEPVSKEEYCLDTICTVSVYGMADENGDYVPASDVSESAEAAIDDAFVLCKELEDKLSKTRADSDIGRLNAAASAWVEISDEASDILKKGLEYSELSSGEFDITVGAVTNLWDFHAADGEEKLPDKKELEEAVKHIDYKNVELDGTKARIKDPEGVIDLGGIAKGYIGDRMTELLEERGVISAVINLGGNVICIGGKTEADDFVIGVETPFSDRTEIIGRIDTRDKTVVTSGVYERKIEVDGKTYHHVLDTKTGMPVETDLDSVTLIADKGRSADIDALSTICLIKGFDEGISLITLLETIWGA